MKIKPLSPYIFEALLALLILVFVYMIDIDLQKTTKNLSENIGILLAIYGAVIALCGGLLLIMTNEADIAFIKWLISMKAESAYRNAAIFTLCSFCFGMIFIGINKIFIDSYVLSFAAIYLVILNIIQVIAMFILVNNYISLKRKWQELR
jgi:hypothetical protein